MGIFGSKPKAQAGPEVTDEDMAILKVKRQRNELERYRERNLIDGERNMARDFLRSGKRDRAALVLRRAKMREKLVAQADSQLESIEQMISTIDFQRMQRDVVAGLEAGNALLRKLNAQMSRERVEAIMDEAREAKEIQDDISSLVSEGVEEADDASIMDELRSLEDEVILNKLPDIPVSESAPEQAALSTNEEEPERVEGQRHEELAVPA